MMHGLILFCTGLVLYAFSFGNQFLWDDEQFIVKNDLVKTLARWPDYFRTNTIEGAGFVSNYYRPLTTLSFALDRAFWNLNPLGFHLTNTLFHALSGVLVYALLNELFKRRFLSFFVALAFIVHPAQVEAVAYINSRGDSLSTFFGLLSTYVLIRKRMLFAPLSSLLFIASFLSKETGIVWAAVNLTIALWLGGRRNHRTQMFVAIVQVLAVATYLLLRFSVLSFQDALNAPPLAVRLSTFILHSIPEYLTILLFPAHLHMERDVPLVFTIQDLSPPALGIFFLLVTGLVIGGAIVRKKNPSLLSAYLFGLTWTGIFLLPFSGIIPMNALLYEHWLYGAMAGWWLSVLVLLVSIVPVRPLGIVFSSLCLLWILLSIAQILRWRDPITLYTYTLRYAETARVQNNLGMAYGDLGNIPQAINHLERSIQLYDGYPQTYHNLANAYKSLGKNDQAREGYKKALTLDPYFFFSLNNLIGLEIEEKHWADAKRWLIYGLEKFPNNETYALLLRQLQNPQTPVKEIFLREP